MRRALFALTLFIYGFSATEMHEWLRVPQVLAHILEHHSDLGHHDEDGEGHQHADLPPGEHDHTPFDDGCTDAFCACSGAAFVPTGQQIRLLFVATVRELRPHEKQAHAASFSGSKWNPPKLG